MFNYINIFDYEKKFTYRICSGISTHCKRTEV